MPADPPVPPLFLVRTQVAVAVDLASLSAHELARFAARRAASGQEFDQAEFRAFEDEMLRRLDRHEVSVNTLLKLTIREVRALDREPV